MQTRTLDSLIEEYGGIIQTGPFGSQLHQADYTEVGIPVVMPKDIIGGRVNESTVARISEQKAAQLSRHFLQVGDIVFPRRGEVGKCALIGKSSERFLCGTGCLKIRLPEKAYSSSFLYYYLGLRQTVEWLERNAVGTTMLNLSAKIIGKLEVPVVALPTQHHIASILSAYDDLIENNQRRLRLLERAARLLYREWFVHFRFPGHERATIIDGVPEGWSRNPLGDILATIESGGRPQGGAKEDGTPSIGAENIIGIGQYDYMKEKFVPDEYFRTMRKGIIRNRDVVLYKDVANIGSSSYFGDGFPHEQCAINEHVFILRALPPAGKNFLYFWLSQTKTRQRVANLNANTAQPGVSQSKLKTLSLLQPSPAVTRLFNETTEPIVRQIFTMAKKNRELTQARALLLSCLMKRRGKFMKFIHSDV